MTNKDNLKNIMEADFNKDNNYNKIMKLYNKNNKIKYTISSLVILIIVGIFVFNNYYIKNNTIKIEDDNIIINSVNTNESDGSIYDSMDSTSYIKVSSTNSINVDLPEYLNITNINYYKLYEDNIYECNLIDYIIDDKTEIKLYYKNSSFYDFNDNISIINGENVYIEYNNINYLVYFNYEDIYYKLEIIGLNDKEVIDIIKCIIKGE